MNGLLAVGLKPQTVTDQNGNVRARHDYLPFGEELGSEIGSRVLASGYSQPDGLRQKFTQKERDNETGLDYFFARYYASTQGRFTSVDPENAGAEPNDPQSWNGYAYTINNPLLYSDPDGREYTICFSHGRNCDTVSDAEFNQIRRDGTALGAVFKDNAIFNDVNGTGELVLTATFERTGFDDFSAQANAVIFGNRNTAGLAQRLPAVETAAEIGFNIASAIISLGTTLGPVGAATLGVGLYSSVAESGSLIAKAASTVGNQSVKASSKAAAERAASEWVGEGARNIVDRQTGEVVGQISADGNKIARFTSVGKAQPYINLVNKATGGNLHVRF